MIIRKNNIGLIDKTDKTLIERSTENTTVYSAEIHLHLMQLTVNDDFPEVM